jgi:hypothetical protein
MAARRRKPKFSLSDWDYMPLRVSRSARPTPEVVSADDIRRLVKRWFAAPHRTSPSQVYQCVTCRILVELMELLDAVDPHVTDTGKPTTRVSS